MKTNILASLRKYKTYWLFGAITLTACIGLLFYYVLEEDLANNCSDTRIKGNISMDDGEKIYHKQGDLYYSKTEIDEDSGERYFCTDKEAEDAGWRHSKV